MDIVKETPGITQAMISQQLNMSRQKVNYHVNSLVDKALKLKARKNYKIISFVLAQWRQMGSNPRSSVKSRSLYLAKLLAPLFLLNNTH